MIWSNKNSKTLDESAKIIREMYAEQRAQSVQIGDIKEDLKEHMARSARNEVMIEYVRKHIYFVQGGIALLGVIATIVAILSKLNII